MEVIKRNELNDMEIIITLQYCHNNVIVVNKVKVPLTLQVHALSAP